MATLEDCDAAARTTLRDGGGTFYRDNLDAYIVPEGVVGGYAVGIFPGTQVMCDRTIADVSDAIGVVLATYLNAPFVGTWAVNGSVHVDPVVILPHRRDAKLLGRALGQKAIYDFVNEKDITL